MARKYARDNRGRFASVGATARGGRLRTASGNKRATVTMKAQGPGGRISKPRGLKPNPSRPKDGELAPKLPGKAKRQNGQLAASSAKKLDLSQAAFEKRANATEKRAKAAEKALSQLDRYSPQNRKALRSAYALRNAADSYASYARRGKTGEFSAEYLFSRRQKSSTAPKLSRSEKAAQTRLANKIKKAEQDRRSFERSRRYR